MAYDNRFVADESILKDYEYVFGYGVNPYAVDPPTTVHDMVTLQCYKEDTYCEDKTIKHVYTPDKDIRNEFRIYKVPKDFDCTQDNKNKLKIEITHDNNMKNIETKQALQKRINELQLQLQNAKNELQKINAFEGFKPDTGQPYYYLNQYGIVHDIVWHSSIGDDKRFKFNNCFKDRESAEKESTKIEIRRKLENIANILNEGKKINWFDDKERHYYIEYDVYRQNLLLQHVEQQNIQMGVIYCLSDQFLNEAISHIGEQELIEYILCDYNVDKDNNDIKYMPYVPVNKTDTDNTNDIPIKYIVGLCTGGVMEDPEIQYTQFQVIEALNEEEARKIYNDKNGCSYYYGSVICKYTENTKWVLKTKHLQKEVVDQLKENEQQQ